MNRCDRHSCVATYFALLCSILLSVNAASAHDQESFQDLWPSEEQRKLVSDRRATFPGAPGFVTDVDWYEPLELVPGSNTRALNIELEDNVTIDAAYDVLIRHDTYAFVYWRDGAIRAERYWGTVTDTTRFDTASMHKTVVALMLGVASDQGLIDSVDDNLAKYLPELANKPQGSIPLKALLEMASGIRTPAFSDDPANPYWQFYLGNDLWQAASHWPIKTKPFEEFYYANANTQYLQWVIERTSGMRYTDFLSKYLWVPIGANTARLWLDREGGSSRASCCLQASARDWLRFGLLLLQNGQSGSQQVVSQEWIEAMSAPSKNNPNYGWQIWRGSPHNPHRSYGSGIPVTIPAKRPFLNEDTIYLDGSGGQRVYVIPSANTVIVRIGKPTFEWDDSELPNLLVRAAQ